MTEETDDEASLGFFGEELQPLLQGISPSGASQRMQCGHTVESKTNIVVEKVTGLATVSPETSSVCSVRDHSDALHALDENDNERKKGIAKHGHHINLSNNIHLEPGESSELANRYSHDDNLECNISSKSQEESDKVLFKNKNWFDNDVQFKSICIPEITITYVSDEEPPDYCIPLLSDFTDGIGKIEITEVAQPAQEIVVPVETSGLRRNWRKRSSSDEEEEEGIYHEDVSFGSFKRHELETVFEGVRLQNSLVPICCFTKKVKIYFYFGQSLVTQN